MSCRINYNVPWDHRNRHKIPTTMDSGVPVTLLPTEILEKILEDVEIKDVIHFALTCKKMYNSVTSTKYLWKRKFLQRWPNLEHKTVHIEDFDWMEETKLRLLCSKTLDEKILQLSAKHYRTQNLSPWDMAEYDSMFLPQFGARHMNYNYLLDALNDFFNDHSNSTHIYYAYKVVAYVSRQYLSREWKKFITLPIEQQTREWILSFFAQWCVPKGGDTFETTAWKINRVADRVKALVAETHPNNPLNFVSRENINRWETETLSKNVWSDEDSKRIWDIVCNVIFNEVGGDSDYPFNQPWCEADRTSQGVLFESVARRVGLKCEIFYGGMDDLRNPLWNLRYNNTKTVETQFFGPVSYNIQETKTSNEFIDVLMDHITCECDISEALLEFLHLREPDDLGVIHRLVNSYMQSKKCVSGFVKKLEDILNNESKDPSVFNVLSRNETALLIQRCKVFESRRSEAVNSGFSKHDFYMLPKLNSKYFRKFMRWSCLPTNAHMTREFAEAEKFCNQLYSVWENNNVC